MSSEKPSPIQSSGFYILADCWFTRAAVVRRSVRDLRARNQHFRVAVASERSLCVWADRLAAINAVVINRWLDYGEVSAAANQYDCIVLSNIEASKSGVVALAYGLGIPVIATPVGLERADRGQGIWTNSWKCHRERDCRRNAAVFARCPIAGPGSP